MCLRRMYNPYVKFGFAYSYFTPEAGVFKHRLLCFCTKFEAVARLFRATAPFLMAALHCIMETFLKEMCQILFQYGDILFV